MTAKNLVIVESPAKAKTISRFLGADFEVTASMGHVRDLPKSKMSIDVEHDFEPTYEISKDKTKVISGIKKMMGADTELWIATDEDREGEAIGWHLLEALKVPVKKRDDVKRIVFHEITEGAIKDAITHPRAIDPHLVDAQQARRVLDRLVGYELSPLLWKKVRYGLSAGRVQSVAVRLVVEREREIRAFDAEEYWSVGGRFERGKDGFEAELSKKDEKKVSIKNEMEANEILDELKAVGEWKIASVETKEQKRTPSPPFITSTLQQEAARKLGFSVKQTMIIAQQLYEGIALPEGHVGLITYMRTDSVNLAGSALTEARDVIEKIFGKDYCLEKPRFYKSKKGAQEAHEAIRPTSFGRAPDEMKSHLDAKQFKLYDLIWKRAMACQMAEARIEQMGVDIVGGAYTFRATGRRILFPGFIAAYVEGVDTLEEEMEDREKHLPKLIEGEAVSAREFIPQQHFTKPPARYTEASLVKKLEAEGIGRPSTYAPTISTIIARHYVEKDDKSLVPTDTGEVVTDLLVEHFPEIVDYKFTARMEDDLDDIADGKKEWVPLMREFYKPFHTLVAEKSQDIKKEDLVKDDTDEVCDKCGASMIVKLGRFGKFLSCSKYPDCKNAKPLKDDGSGEAAPESEEMKELKAKLADKKCSKCGEPMVIKTGRYGEFLGCSAYPKCKNIENIVKDSGVACPECGKAMIERRTRKGAKLFWGCSGYPKCKFATWDKPVRQCEKCKGVVVLKKDEEKCMQCGG